MKVKRSVDFKVLWRLRHNTALNAVRPLTLLAPGWLRRQRVRAWFATLRRTGRVNLRYRLSHSFRVTKDNAERAQSTSTSFSIRPESLCSSLGGDNLNLDQESRPDELRNNNEHRRRMGVTEVFRSNR
jgi:hypothetical protein